MEKKLIFPSCFLCGAEDFQPLYLIHDCQIVRCPHCRLVYTREIPARLGKSFSYEEAYFQNPAFASAQIEKYFGYDAYISDQENIQDKFSFCLRQIMKYQAAGKVLDLGCAAGFFLDLAHQRGFEVLGVEPSRFASRKARELFGLPVLSQTLRDAGLPAKSFDVITLWDVIEHVPQPREEMQEVRRLLKPGGLVGIITPDIENPAARILKDKWLEIRRVPEHLVFFSAHTLKRLLAENGFAILETRTIGKKFCLGSLIRNFNFQLRVLGLPVLPVPDSNWRIPLTINPRYKLFLLARKISNP